MGYNQSKEESKEEIIVAETASGGNNNAGIQQMNIHANTTNIILTIILCLMSLGFLYMIYRIYKKCHTKWMANEINRHALRRSITYLRRGPFPKTEEV